MKLFGFIVSGCLLGGVCLAENIADTPVTTDTAVVETPKISAAEQKRNEEMVMKALSALVKRQVNGEDIKKEAAKLVAFIKDGSSFNTGAKRIAECLAGEDVKESSLLFAVEDNPNLSAMAFLTLFTTKVWTGRTTDKNALISHLDNYARLAKSGGSPYVTLWTKRVSAWKEWIQSDFARKPGNEKLLDKASGFDKLADVPKPDFIQRYTALKRPDINIIDFDKEAAAEYLRGITDVTLQRAENRRFACVTQVKNYVVHLLARNTFEGKIMPKTGGSFFGGIVRANENVVQVRKGNSSRAKTTSYDWNDFKLEQWAEVVESFGKRRQTVSTKAGEATQKRDAGDDLVIASVLYLLAGQPDRAYDTAVDAEKLSPAIQKKIKKIYCDSLPSKDDDKEIGTDDDK